MKFLQRIVVNENNCWLFQGAIKKQGLGYGWVVLNNKRMGAHRASWIVKNGPIQDGLCVCHKCDIPSCINPDHLFLGTHSDNMQDMWNKKRHQIINQDSENHPRAKLNLEQVKEIKIMLSKKIKQRIIAGKFNVSQVAISNIKLGTRWKELTKSDLGLNT